MSDVAVIGGGIAGCATAALLAEAGAAVTLFEREAIGAGASGRNSGIVQHPMDPALAALYEDSLALYRELGHGFELPAEPTGVLIVSEDDSLRRGLRGGRGALPRAGARVARGRRRCAQPSPRWARACTRTASAPAGRSGRPPPRARGRSGRARPARGSCWERRRGSRARAASIAGGRRTPPGRSWSPPGRGRPRRSAALRTGGRFSPTGASSPRCVCATRRATRSSRPASRR